MRIYVTESQFNELTSRLLSEEEQVIRKSIGSFGELNARVVDAIRKKFGFDQWDCRIESNEVVIYVEKDNSDYPYAYSMVQAVIDFAKSLCAR